MALMTACPSCDSHFKIVADQLRLHNGLVRCGACNSVFDASKSLRPMPPDPPAPLTEPVPPAWQDKAVVQALLQPSEPQLQTPASVPTAPQALATAQTDTLHNNTSLTQFNVEKLVTGNSAQPEYVDSFAQSAFEPAFKPAFAQEDAALARQSSPAYGAQFWFFSLLCMLLACLAAVQAAVYWRYTVADLIPASKPILTELCVYMQCKLEPADTLEPLSLETLILRRISSDEVLNTAAEYELSAVVRNASSLTVKAPRIELSLTNAQTQTIARRVLTVEELGMVVAQPAQAVIAPQQDWNINVKLLLDPQTLGFSGRLVDAQ